MKKSVLIVDDDMNNLETMASLLSHDYNIYTASNGIDALHVFEENKDIRLVLTDFLMPEMNGLDLLEQILIKDEKAFVIMMTGVLDVELRTEAMNYGAYYYLNKPVDFNILELAIKRVI